MSEDKFGDEDPQVAGFLISSKQINMEQIKEELDNRYAAVEDLESEKAYVGLMSLEIIHFMRISKALTYLNIAGLIGIFIWLLFLK